MPKKYRVALPVQPELSMRGDYLVLAYQLLVKSAGCDRVIATGALYWHP